MTTNIVTLDFIRDAAEAEYAGLTVETPQGPVKLRNPIRLSKDERAALKAHQAAGQEEREARKAQLEEYKAAVKAYEADPENVALPDELPDLDDEAQFKQVGDLLVLLADDKGRGQALVASLGNDIALAGTVMSLYNKAVSPGEA